MLKIESSGLFQSLQSCRPLSRTLATLRAIVQAAPSQTLPFALLPLLLTFSLLPFIHYIHPLSFHTMQRPTASSTSPNIPHFPPASFRVLKSFASCLSAFPNFVSPTCSLHSSSTNQLLAITSLQLGFKFTHNVPKEKCGKYV